MKSRIKLLPIAIIIALFSVSCANTEVVETEVSNLKKEISNLQNALVDLQSTKEEEAKTELDATGMAIVDLEKLLSQYKGYQKAQSQFEFRAKQGAEKITAKETKLQEDYVTAQKSAKFLSEDQYKAKAEELQKVYEEIAREKEAFYKDVELTERKLLKDVLDKVNGHLKKYAEDYGYKMILFTQVENSIFYAQDEINITDEYIKALNEAYDNGFR